MQDAGPRSLPGGIERNDHGMARTVGDPHDVEFVPPAKQSASLAHIRILLLQLLEQEIDAARAVEGQALDLGEDRVGMGRHGPDMAHYLLGASIIGDYVAWDRYDFNDISGWIREGLRSPNKKGEKFRIIDLSRRSYEDR